MNLVSARPSWRGKFASREPHQPDHQRQTRCYGRHRSSPRALVWHEPAVLDEFAGALRCALGPAGGGCGDQSAADQDKGDHGLSQPLVVYADRLTKTESHDKGKATEREIPFMKGYQADQKRFLVPVPFPFACCFRSRGLSRPACSRVRRGRLCTPSGRSRSVGIPETLSFLVHKALENICL